MSLIYWDSMLFVYWLEDHPEFGARLRQIRRRMRERGDVLCTSTFTIGELLVGVLKRRDHVLAGMIDEALRPPTVSTLPFGRATARLYAQVRADHAVSAADAIHLACAAEAGVDLFLTNDRNLVGRIIPGIGFVAGLDVNLF